jgi:hypothetical protein
VHEIISVFVHLSKWPFDNFVYSLKVIPEVYVQAMTSAVKLSAKALKALMILEISIARLK